ncbi:histidine phosphatase family protein [Enemella dayhoffiae]|uniref:histidine phosphatase family protein n=1 Tax=Enemella dayhoffiae TaxID=2016507 RepID=UPI0015954D0C|nr:histidine phosphatase family protein [Enemella dayhoffiae]
MTAHRLVVWRHGQTDWNLERRWQGEADIPLNATGLAQAAAAAPAVAALGVSEIWASPLQRAYATAEALAAQVGCGIRTDTRLREIGVGEWSGRVLAELQEEFGDVLERESRGEDVVRGRTGESVRQVEVRVAEALREIGEQASDGAVVAVVMHGLAGKVGALELVGVPAALKEAFGGLDNCGWIVIDHSRQLAHPWRITHYNQTAG